VYEKRKYFKKLVDNYSCCKTQPQVNKFRNGHVRSYVKHLKSRWSKCFSRQNGFNRRMDYEGYESARKNKKIKNQ